MIRILFPHLLKTEICLYNKKVTVVDTSTGSYIDITSSEETSTDRKELPQYCIIIDTDKLKSIIKFLAGLQSARTNT